MDDQYDAIRSAFTRAIADPTGASDGEFCAAMAKQFFAIFEEELAKEMAKKREAA